MNCGLTRFNRGSYTLSLWSVSPRESPQTSSLLGIPPSFIAVWGRSATRQRSLLDYAQPAAVGLRGRTEHNLGYAASATRRAETLRAARLPDLSSAIKIFPFLRSRASGVHPTTSACNRIRYRPMSIIFYTLFCRLSIISHMFYFTARSRMPCSPVRYFSRVPPSVTAMPPPSPPKGQGLGLLTRAHKHVIPRRCRGISEFPLIPMKGLFTRHLIVIRFFADGQFALLFLYRLRMTLGWSFIGYFALRARVDLSSTIRNLGRTE